jgi:hypothetical protein
MSDTNDTQIHRVTDSKRIVARGPIHEDVARTLLMMRDVQRPQLSRFGPREERASKRIRRWAEVGFSVELAAVRNREKPCVDFALGIWTITVSVDLWLVETYPVVRGSTLQRLHHAHAPFPIAGHLANGSRRLCDRAQRALRPVMLGANSDDLVLSEGFHQAANGPRFTGADRAR